MYKLPTRPSRLALIALLFVSLYGFGQLPSADTWFMHTMGGDLRKATFGKDAVLFEYVGREGDPKMTEKMSVEKRLDNNLILVKSEKKSNKYILFQLAEAQDGSRLDIIPVAMGSDAKALAATNKKQAVAEWKSLMAQSWYSPAQIEQLEKAPGLDEVSREDLMTSLQWRDELAQKLEAYFEANPDANQFIVYRFIDGFRNRKLVELGYNPFKRVAYNFEEKFRDDPELIKLLTEEVKF